MKRIGVPLLFVCTLVAATAAGAGKKSGGAKATPSPSPVASPSPEPSPSPTPKPPAPRAAIVPAPAVDLANAPEPTLEVTPTVASNGGAVLAIVHGLVKGDSVTGTFAGDAVPFWPGDGEATALVGVDLNVKTGTSYVVDARIRRGKKTIHKSFNLRVEDAHYEVQRVNGLPPEKVNPNPESLKRIEREAKELAAFWPIWTPTRYWHGAFIKPVPGIVIEKFGGRRVINGEDRAPHSGYDQRAPTGTPIHAINAGVIVLAEEQFFCGNTTVIDHGQGVYSMYCHQSKLLVKVGQKVEKGEVIGLTGATGRVTGPHIHWGVRVDDARVDPAKLFTVDLSATEQPGFVLAIDTAGEAAAMVMGSAEATTIGVAGSAGTAAVAGNGTSLTIHLARPQR